MVNLYTLVLRQGFEPCTLWFTRLSNVKVLLNLTYLFDNAIFYEQREQEDILTRSFNGLELSGEEERQAIFNTEPVVSDDISKVIIANNESFQLFIPME